MTDSAEYKKAKAAYGALVDHFTFYASYHSNNVNKWIHIICVPMILTTAFYMLSFIPVGSYAPPIVSLYVKQYLGFPVTAALVIALCYMFYYLYLSPNFVGITAFAYVGISYYIAGNLYLQHGADIWNTCVIIHIVSWIAQFYGHGVHEGRSPALLDNLFQALFISPLFVWIEILIMVGFLKDFVKAIDPVVQNSIKQWKESKKAK